MGSGARNPPTIALRCSWFFVLMLLGRFPKAKTHLSNLSTPTSDLLKASEIILLQSKETRASAPRAKATLMGYSPEWVKMPAARKSFQTQQVLEKVGICDVDDSDDFHFYIFLSTRFAFWKPQRWDDHPKFTSPKKLRAKLSTKTVAVMPCKLLKSLKHSKTVFSQDISVNLCVFQCLGSQDLSSIHSISYKSLRFSCGISFKFAPFPYCSFTKNLDQLLEDGGRSMEDVSRLWVSPRVALS